jgi:hypothetical protein
MVSWVERADKKTEKVMGRARTRQKAIFTGWTCPAGPAEFVNWLEDRGTQVSYRTFAANVDLSEWHASYREMGLALSKDWGITWLKSELLDGSRVWVLQWSAMEHLFAYPGQDWESTRDAIVHVAKRLTDKGWPSAWTWDEINAVLVNELGWEP